jgi:hypothetical protein
MLTGAILDNFSLQTRRNLTNYTWVRPQPYAGPRDKHVSRNDTAISEGRRETDSAEDD